jgi:hypothetical protein
LLDCFQSHPTIVPTSSGARAKPIAGGNLRNNWRKVAKDRVNRYGENQGLDRAPVEAKTLRYGVREDLTTPASHFRRLQILRHT